MILLTVSTLNIAQNKSEEKVLNFFLKVSARVLINRFSDQTLYSYWLQLEVAFQSNCEKVGSKI
jgi:hypothetical protein